ncbi:MAG TPA: hydantoinase/oxoprolinase family protein [Gemmatimonadales bacterium]|nr:hydantoinase/oxoprolinase family protein [Gemmatimonadales bacterium]
MITSRGSDPTYSVGVLGWDLGGVNTKTVRLTLEPATRTFSLCTPYELQRNLAALGPTLRSAARQLGGSDRDLHAITMTAELSQAFRTKREGVDYILSAFEATFPPERLHVYTVAGKFVSPHAARQRPIAVAASNWSATAHWVATLVPTCVLIDIGTTTTDLIPILNGEVSAQGRTDLERLGCGELVYTGALRTPVESVAYGVTLRGRATGLAAEAFALMGDVYLWQGLLQSCDYTCPTPDRRPATKSYAGERLARAVCADREMLNEADIDQIAAALGVAQVQRITHALEHIRWRHPEIETAVITGLGAFVGVAAAGAAGLRSELLSERAGGDPQVTPAAAVARLLVESLAAAR